MELGDDDDDAAIQPTLPSSVISHSCCSWSAKLFSCSPGRGTGASLRLLSLSSNSFRCRCFATTVRLACALSSRYCRRGTFLALSAAAPEVRDACAGAGLAVCFNEEIRDLVLVVSCLSSENGEEEEE